LSCVSTTVLTVGVWYHVVIKWSQSEGKFSIFVNGVKEDEAIYDKFPTILQPLYVGIHPQYGRQGSLFVDDLRISNIARTDAEILADYNSGAALPVDGYTTAKLNFDGNTLAEGYSKYTGDLWYAPTAKLLKRYNGTSNAWELINIEGTISGVTVTASQVNNILYGSTILRYAIGSTIASNEMVIAHGLNTGLYGFANAQASGTFANCLVSATGIQFFVQNNSGVITSSIVNWIVYGN
jgi:hypothetical protein